MRTNYIPRCHLAPLRGRKVSLFVAVALLFGSLFTLSVSAGLVVWGSQTLDTRAFDRPIIQVAAGYEHTVALKDDGTVVAWGGNSHGQTNVPAGLGNVVTIAAGKDHTVALKDDGSVVAWGDNRSGQTNVPEGLGSVVAISAGNEHTVALKDDGTVVAWGRGDDNQTNVPADLNNVTAIAAGGSHTVALQDDGTVVAWGRDHHVPFGLDNIAAIAAGSHHTVALKDDGSVVAWGGTFEGGQANVPAGLSNIVAIAAGTNHSLALKDDGTIAAWGNGAWQAPVPAGLDNVVSIAAGMYHSVALKDGGTIVAWGRGSEGQTVIPATLDNIAAIAAGGAHTVALRDDGSVVAWGDNNQGQTNIPTGLSNVAAIAAGWAHTVALKDDGSVVAWGDNNQGQTNVPADLGNVTAIATGDSYTVVLKSDGSVIAWGNNSSGQTNVPDELGNVIAIAAGRRHTVALKSDGSVIAWGDNSSGQTDVPDELGNVIAIAAGKDHTVALKGDGTIVAWGYNNVGQTDVPDGLNGVVAIAARHNHNLALKYNGTVVAWGSDSSSQASVPDGLTSVVAVAAGSTHSLALVAPLQIDSNPITPNTVPIPGSIAQPWELDEWTFFVPGGSRLAIAVTTSATDMPFPALEYAQISLSNEAGATIASTQSSTAGQTAVLHDIPIPTDGLYRVHVRHRQLFQTGHYRIAVWETSSARQLVLNQQHLGHIASPDGVEHWTFTAAAGQQVRFDLVSASAGAAFTLLGPGGWSGFANISASSEAIFPESDTYTLTAFGTEGASGLNYAFRLVETEPLPLTLDTPHAGQFLGNGDARLFRLEVPGGGPLELSLKTVGTGSRTEIYASRNVPPSRVRHEHSDASGPDANRRLFIPAASAGVWYILVYADKAPDAPVDYTLEARMAGVALSELSIASQASNVITYLTISGAGFRSGTVVELVSDTGEVYAAASVEVDAYDRITATFPANAAPPDVYDVRVTHPDGGSATLPNAFTLLPSGTPELETKLIIPSSLGRHATATIYLEYANIGSASMPAPLLIVKSADPDGSDRPILTLDANRIVENFWSGTADLPPGTSSEILILAHGAQPGMLAPGERRTIPIHYMGLLQPWNFSDNLIEMEVRHWAADDPSPIGWASRKESLRPPTLEPAIWDVVYANLVSGLATNADYVAMLSDNARYLGRLGLRVLDVDELWNFEVQQAYGYSALPVLDAATDVAVAVPGIPLGLSRQFSSNLRSRNASGPFGQGWFTPWQARLVVERNGDLVKFVGEAGAASVYSRDTRKSNVYFSGAGDSSQLTATGGGTYELRQSDGTVTRFRADGRIDYVQDANGNRVTASWNGTGQLASLAHSSGASITLAYGGNGLVSQATASTGHSVSYAYEGTHLVSATTDDGKATLYTYDTAGPAARRHAMTSVTQAGVTRHFAWDARGRLASTHTADGEETVAFAYDSAGSVAVTQADATTTLFFEHRGLLAKTADPLGHITTSEYDKDLRLKRLVLPTGESRSFTWCVCGSPASITDELGHTTRFKYDHPLKRMTHFTDAKGNLTRYTYDAKGNLLSTIYADNSAETLANYTATGLPQTQTNRRGQAVHYTWTATGQVERQTFADGSHNDFGYDARGNLIQISEYPIGGPTKITAYTYDHAAHGDRLKRVDYPDGKWVEYFYDAAGCRVRMTDSAGGDTRYEYDSAGRLWKLRDATDAVLVEYHYDAAGRLLRINKGNGTHTTYQYDAAGQILSLINHAPDGTPNSRFDYTYDARGRRTGMDTLDGKWTYAYDATGQLVHAVFASTNPEIEHQDLRYHYDALGNRTSTVINGETTVYVPNHLNQYSSVGGTAHQYDADGNLTFDGERTLEYDVQNRLIRVTGPHGATEHEYDTFGSRTASVTNGERTDYLLDPTGIVNVLAEETGSTIRQWIHSRAALIASKKPNDSSNVNFFDLNASGSVSGITQNSGLYSSVNLYTPFGTPITEPQESIFGSFWAFGAVGISSDTSGLLYVRARYFSPSSGRFCSVDPIRIGGNDVNFYRYSLNNPVSFIDPSGLQSWEWNFFLAIGGGVNFAFNWGGDLICPTFTYGVGGGLGFGVGLGANTGGGPGESMIVTGGWPGGPGGSVTYNPDGTRDVGMSAGVGGGLYGGKQWTRSFCDPKNRNQRAAPSGEGPGTLGGTGSSGTVAAIDPNEKIGPGTGPEGWVTADALLPYRINFENIGPGSVDENGDPYPIFATAPAQRVTITDDLEAGLDWDNFQITDFGWGDTLVHVEPGTSHHTGRVLTTTDGKTFEVEVEIGIDYSTGRIVARFQSLELGGSLPPDALTGMLPPEDGTGRGMGHFSYTIRSKADLPTGTAIRNIALIQFDSNEIIATNQIDPQDASKGTSPDKEALVTLDGDAPSATVTALPATNGSPNFTVKWSGSDTGSGIAAYDLYVSVDGGPWERWLTGTTETSALFAGQRGRRYGFLAVARDRAGNAQPMGSAAQAATTVLPRDSVRPVIRLTGPKASGPYPASGRIRLKGTATDNRALASWAYKLNRDRWKTGGRLSGTSRPWSKTVGKVKPGKNSVQVRAHDAAGLVSKSAKRNLRLKKR